ncbi:MAG: IS1634 family transposase [Candidatus Methanomethylophilaceae archaeon]|nr:IS1634 family transposase [Candidatus Methanomethylophilaceae archaeon]
MAFRREDYSGIPASSALAMALMESSGIRQMIDDACEYDVQRLLTPGNAVKAMIGPIFDARKKSPLSKIHTFYHSAPIRRLFGSRLNEQSLNDQAFGRSLDTLYDADRRQLMWDCADSICRRYGLQSDVYHMDSTDFSVYAEDDKDDVFEAIPMFNGHPKDGRCDLRQYAVQSITDGNNIIRFVKPYSGNVVDSQMDMETLDFLEENIDCSNSVLVADCKLVNDDLVDRIFGMRLGFVSKCPESFGKKAAERIRYSAENGIMDPSITKDGWELYDCDDDIEICGVNRRLRFIAYRIPAKKDSNLEYLKVQGEREVRRVFKRFSKEMFSCESDARKQFSLTLGKLKGSAYDVSADFIPVESRVKRKGRGRSKKDDVPEIITEWKVDVSYKFDSELAERMAGDEDIRVIITNLPRMSDRTVGIRTGADADAVLRLYLDEYKVESNYALMKSGMGIDQVYLQTPSRESSMIFVIGIATLLSDVITKVLKDNGIGKTSKTVNEELVSLILKEGTEDIVALGKDDSIDQLETYVKLLKLDPESLLGVF